MLPSVVRCSMPDCGAPAEYKIAAPWSDGRFSELKTYGHACSRHIGPVYRDADLRRATYKAAPGESVDEIGIYRFEPGRRDRQLERRRELEKTYRSWGSGSEGV
jgi:hypothetical protein